MTYLTTHAKWILSGEHSVILNYPALVFPVPNLTLKLSIDQSSQFTIKCNHDHLKELNKLIHQFKQLLGIHNTPAENLEFNNSIPIGQGLGFSGALCSILAKWAAHHNWVSHHDIFHSAQTLEHNFHGKSSGVDIAGCLATTGLIYQNKNWSTLPNKHFHLYISYTGRKSKTHLCVEKVDRFRKQFDSSQSIDKLMEEATKLGIDAFKNDSFESLKKCILYGHTCFSKWGLIDPQTEHHISTLINAGAIACKPTGSGLGGHVISLWEKSPPPMPFALNQALPSP
ncbi:MAG TPA: hypothetical protein QF353_02800 [Gammaproteobacteria bacterium]|nr:hypothetical protein [Gammaproteobacteria bacterium]